MIPEIERKLSQHIQAGIETEADVAYLMVCVRKILEQEQPDNKYQNLKFHCDWILHSKLSYESTVGPIFKIFEDSLEELINKIETDKNKLIKICKLDSFKEQLENFLKQHSLPIFWENDERTWPLFLSLYTAIIHDSPLTLKTNRSSPIKEIVVRLEWGETYRGYINYRIDWGIHLKNGQETGVSIYNSFSAELIS